MPEYRYRFGERVFEVSLEPAADGHQRAVIREGETITALIFKADSLPGGWRLHLPAGQRRAITAVQDDNRDVWINGFTYALKREAEPANRTQGGGTVSGRIEAQMPGLVRDVLVERGDQVERGQTLVILEAMKMELRAAAPFDGMVKSVSVSKGEIVARGQVLVEVEPNVP
ncbi:MAG: biotin/lipoyl-binding protein [Anaerolineae bacterium]|nr:biotin/lipoyl-binding protein [Anaerolineae bacterium]